MHACILTYIHTHMSTYMYIYIYIEIGNAHYGLRARCSDRVGSSEIAKDPSQSVSRIETHAEATVSCCSIARPCPAQVSQWVSHA